MVRADHLRVGLLVTVLLGFGAVPPTIVRAAGESALLVAVVATGGSSASDEYVVIEAVGSGGANIADFEVIYTSASGATTRRLASLEGVAPLADGSRLLVANSLGSYAAGAVATWSEGIAATGGSVRLRMRAAPTVIADAVAWGSATAAAGGFGMPAAAMSSTTMIERRRSGDLTLVNTLSNGADFTLVPVAAPNLTPVVPRLPSPQPTSTTAPSAIPSTVPSTTPSPTATSSSTTTPTQMPTQLPTPVPTPSPTPISTPVPTPSPTPHVFAPTEVRAAPLGETLALTGTVSAAPGELSEERLYCVEDSATGAGIFVLAQVGDTDLARGDIVTVSGRLMLRRQALTVIATSTVLVDGAAEPREATVVSPPKPGPWSWEPWEGRTIEVTGSVVGSVKELAGGSRSLTLRLAAGGEILVGIGPNLVNEVPATLLSPRSRIVVGGVLHQRSGSAGGGYRVWALAVTASRPVAPSTPVSTPRVVGQGSLPAEGPSSEAATLPGTPSIALPSGAPSWWARRVAELLTVRLGSLVVGTIDAPALVVLPSCGEAQSVPESIRAGNVVDRAGHPAYPQRR